MKLRLPLILASLLLSALTATVSAATYTWTGASSNSMTEGGNWEGLSSGPLTFQNDIITLGQAGAGNKNLTTSEDISLGGIIVNDSGYSLNAADAAVQSLVFNAPDSADKIVFDINEDFTLGSFKTITVNSALEIDIAQGKNFSMSPLSGSSPISVMGLGRLAVSIENNTGTFTSLGSGTLDIAQDATVTIGDSTHVFGQAGAQNTNDTFSKTVTGKGTLEIYLDGVNDGTQHLINLGNDFAGTVIIKQGMLCLNSGNGGNSFATNIGKGTLSFDGGTFLFIRNTSGGNFTNAINIGTGEVRFRFYGNTNSTLSGKLTGNADSVIKQVDGGKITLTGDMSEFGGTYDMNSGQVAFNNNGIVYLKTLTASGNSFLQSGTMVLDEGFTGNAFKVGKLDGTAVDNPVTLSGTADWDAAGNIELKGTSQFVIDTRKYNTAAKTYETSGLTLTLGGIISGNTGELKKAGAGTLVLSGANTYGGKTTVEAGTLQIGAGGTAGALGNTAIEVQSGAILTFNRSDAYTVNNTISGDGALSFLGGASSVYNLTGNLALTGSITLGGGATLKWNQPGETALSNKITGNGIVEISQGTTSLTGANDFTGSVKVDTGATLKVESESDLGAAANGVTLVNNSSIDFAYTGTFSRNFTLEGNGIFSVEEGQKITLTSSASSAAGKTLTKTGTGELVLTSGGIGSTLSHLAVNGGTLTLQFGAGGLVAVNPTATLTMGGGVLSLDTNGQTAAVQNFASTSLSAGLSHVDLSGSSMILNLGITTGTGKVLLTGLTGNTVQALGTTLIPGQFLSFDGTGIQVATGLDPLTGTLTFTDSDYEQLPSAGATADKKYFLNGSGSVTESESAAVLLLMSKTGDANTLTIENGKTLTVAGALSYTGSDYSITGGSLILGSLDKSGDGTLSISSALTAPDITVSSGQLVLTGSVVSTGSISLTGDLIIDTTTSGNQTLAGALSGNGALVKTGTGELTLSGASSAYAGEIQVENGKLLAAIENNTASVASLGSGTLNINQGATVTIGDSTHVFGPVLGQNNSSTLTKTVTGKGTLEVYLDEKNNNTQLLINVGNNFEGTVVIKQGMLALNPGNGDGFATNVGKGTLAFDAGTAMWIRNTVATFAAPLQIGGGEVRFRFYGNTNSTLSGKITGSATSVIKQIDGGKITLTGDMSEFGGTYNMSDGQVAFNNNGVVYLKTLATAGTAYLQSGTMVLDDGFTGNNFKIGKLDGTATTAPVTLSGTKDWSSAGNIELKGTSQLVVDTRKYDTAAKEYGTEGLNLTMSGILSGTEGTVKKAGAGTLILTGTNTYGGLTTVSGGTLQLGDGETTGSVAGEITVAAGAFLTFSLSGNVAVGNTLTGAGTVQFKGTGSVYTLSNTGNTISEFLLTEGTLKPGAVGALGTGKVTLRGGLLEYGIAGDYTNNIVLDTAANNAQISSTVTGSGAVLKGSITGTGNLEKSGTGLLILDDAAPYANGQAFTGNVIVSAGTLQLGQAPGGDTAGGRQISYGSGSISVADGATLSIAFAEAQSTNTLTNKVSLGNDATLYISNGNTVLNDTLTAGSQAGDSVNLSFQFNQYLKLNKALEGAGTLYLSETSTSQYSAGDSGLILTQDSTAFNGTIEVGHSLGDSIQRYGQYLQLDSAKAASGANITLKAASAADGALTNTQLLVNANNTEIGGLNGETGTLVLSGATKNTGDSVTRNLIINGTGTYSGSLDSHLTLTKRGAGTTQTLAGTVLSAGTQMTVESGTLALGTGTGTLGTGLLTSSYEVQTGGVLLINEASADANASTVTGEVTLTGGQLQFKADLDGNSFGQKIIFAANGSSITGGSANADHRGWVLSSGASTETDAALIKVNAGVTGSTISVGKIYLQNTNEDGAAIFDLATGTTLELSSILAGVDANAALKIRSGGTLIYTGSDNGSNQPAVKAIVENGTLQIGNGGTTGNWANGDIQLGATGAADGTGATVVFNRSDAMTYGGIISGKGTLNFAGGAGSVYTLQGANTFTGDININGGKVIAGHATAFGSGNTVNLQTGAAVDYAASQTDTTSTLNAAAGSSILNGSNFNGKLNILDNTSATAVTVTGGLSVTELAFANNSYLNVTGALSSGQITLSEGSHLNGDSLTMRNVGTLEIGQNASASFTGGIASSTNSSITLKTNGALQITGNATGGTLTLEQTGNVTVTSGNLSLEKLVIQDAASHVTVGGNLTVNNGGYLYMDTTRATTPSVTATGALNLNGSFLLGFDVNQVTQVTEYTFKLFGANTYGNIQAQLDFSNGADRSFYYLDTSNFSTDGSVTLVHTDWGYELVNAADIAAMGSMYTPTDGKVLLGSKSEANGGGTRDNPLAFHTGYTPVSNTAGETDYRLTDGEGWLNFQTQMTGSGTGLLVQGDLGFTGDAADHGLIISNNNNDYTGPTRVQNAHVVLDSSLADQENDKITSGAIGMLGTGDITFMGNLAVLELRPGGDAAGSFTLSNNLALKDGATLIQTGGSTGLTGNLTLIGGLGGTIQNATASKLALSGGIIGTTLTLKGNAAAVAGAESLIELTETRDPAQRVLNTLVLQDKIQFTLNGANLEAQNLTLTSGQLTVTSQSELRLGAVTGTANGKLKLDGGKLTTVGTGGLITLGGGNSPQFELAGTGNIITVGNTGGMRINNLTGSAAFTLGGGSLTLGGGSTSSHYQGDITIAQGTLTLAQDTYITGSITTTSPASGSALALQVNGGSSTAQRTTTGDIRLSSGTTASLTGDHMTLGSITLSGNAILGTTAQTAANDVLIDALTIESTGSAAFGNDLHIKGNAQIGEGSLQSGNNTLIEGSLTLGGGTALLGSNVNILGTTTLSNGTLLMDNGTLAGLAITGTGTVAGRKTAGETQSLTVNGNADIGNGHVASDAITLSSGAAHDAQTTLQNGSIVAADTLKIDNLTITGTGTAGTSKTTAGNTATIYGSAAIGNGLLSSGQVTVGGPATLQDGTIQASGDIRLGSLAITGTGTVQTDTSDLTKGLTKGLTVNGNAQIGNGTVRTGTLSITGNTELHDGSLTALSDNTRLQGNLTISGTEGSAVFQNNTTIEGSITNNGGTLTIGNSSTTGDITLNGGSATLGDHASVGSLNIGNGGTFSSGDNTGIATGTGEHITIGSNATVDFGRNTTLGASGNALDIATGATVSFGQGSTIQGSLGDRGLTFATGSAYTGFLKAGNNNVTFEDGSIYRLDGPVLQQYTPTTTGLTSTGTINIGNGTRFVLGDNLRDYSILESPDTMTLVKADNGGKLLIGGQQVKDSGNYSYLLENADKYFEWFTFNLIGSNNALELEKIQSIHFEKVADTANESAMATIANSLATGARYYEGELKKLGASLALTAKGDGHKALSELAQSNASLLSGYMAQTRELRRHNHDILAQASQEKTGAERLSYEQYHNTIWANGTGGTYTLDGDNNAPGYKTTQWGGTLGASRAYGEHLVGGLAFSYMHTDTTVDSHYGEAKGNSYDIDLFAKYNRDNWNITGVITGGLTSLDTTRHLQLDGYSSRTTASGDGSHLLATIQAGYQITASNDQNSIIEPFLLISGGYSSIDSLSEKGAGNAGLTTDSRTQGLCTIGAGLKFTREYIADEEDCARGRFEMRVMALQDLTEVNGDLTAGYQGMGQKFSLDGASSSRLGILAGLGLSHPLSQQTSLFGNVDGEFRKRETGVRANIGVKITF